MSKNVSISSLLAGDRGEGDDSRELIMVPDEEVEALNAQKQQVQVQQEQPPTQPIQTNIPQEQTNQQQVPDQALSSAQGEHPSQGQETKKPLAKPGPKSGRAKTQPKPRKTTKAQPKAAPNPRQTKPKTAKAKTSNTNATSADASTNSDTNTNVPTTDSSDLKDLVSRFRTNIIAGNADSPIIIDDGPVPVLEPSPLPYSPSKSLPPLNEDNKTTFPKAASVAPINPTLASASPSISNLMTSDKLQDTISDNINTSPYSGGPNRNIADHIKRFQTNFQFTSPSKTSISSIINVDEPEYLPQPEIVPSTTAITGSPGDKLTDKAAKKTPAPKKQEKRKLEKKPTGTNKRKKSPETKPPEKEIIHLKPPELIDVSSKLKGEEPNGQEQEAEREKNNKEYNSKDETIDPEKEKEKEKERERERAKEKEREREREREKELERIEMEKKEKKDLPIIALNIPLLDPQNPKPGQSEVVVNVLKLAEDKYGWSTIHPEAKSAIEVMDDLIEDNDDDENKDDENKDDENKDDENKDDENKDDEDEEEEELEDGANANVNPSVNSNSNANAGSNNRKKKDENLTEEQLMRQHQTRMNRKVGKYDYEDPFIDDDELQWEEKISSTKEGFFVYWGPLIEERNNNSQAKRSNKKK